MVQTKLHYDHPFWDGVLGKEYQKQDLEHKLHLIFSLILYLNVYLYQLFEFIFDSSITAVRRRAGRFMGFFASGKDPERRFHPAIIYKLWHDNFPTARPHLHDMIQECAREIVLEESDSIIEDPALKVNTSKLTHLSIQNLLSPGTLVQMYKEHAPFTWSLLWTFSASPNRYRKGLGLDEPVDGGGEPILDDELDDDPNLDDRFSLGGDEVPDLMKGFSRNPVFAVLVAIAMLTFVRNRATNALALLCGLFFKIEGASSRLKHPSSKDVWLRQTNVPFRMTFRAPLDPHEWGLETEPTIVSCCSSPPPLIILSVYDTRFVNSCSYCLCFTHLHG